MNDTPTAFSPQSQHTNLHLHTLLESARLLFSRQLSKMRSSKRFSFALLRRVLVVIVGLLLAVIVSVFFFICIIKRHENVDFREYETYQKLPLSRKNLALKIDFPFETGCRVPDTKAPRANGAIVMLARNSELEDVVSSMRSMERHFNQWFKYPWVFLNDEEFSSDFKTEIFKHTEAEVEFGLVPQEHWNFPKDVDKDELAEFIQGQGDREILYGNLESYHKMCRFYSGNFYSHPLVQKRTWYWRVEPDVEFYCDLTYDPFIEMERHNKKYGFNVILEEIYYTVPSLFLETKSFINSNNIKVKSAWDIMVKKYQTLTDKTNFDYFTWKNMADLRTQIAKNLNLHRFLNQKMKTNDDLENIKEFKNIRNIFEDATRMPTLLLDKIQDEEYNMCHFWSNFEIARTDLFLSETYQKYFKHLESVGGFYKERWGDAPVHSLAVAMMLSKDELHYFRDIGYKHSTFGHCPSNAPFKQLSYVSNGFSDYAPQPWYNTFYKLQPDKPQRNGVGCRCKCPRRFQEIEDTSPYCVKQYVQVVSDNYNAFLPVDINNMQAQIEEELDNRLAAGETFADRFEMTSSRAEL